MRIPLAIEQYHEVAAVIDRHNCVRQDAFDLEQRTFTRNWVLRLPSTIIGIPETNTRLLYNSGRSESQFMSAHVLLFWLGSEVADTNIDTAVIFLHYAEYCNTEEQEIAEFMSGEKIELVPCSSRVSAICSSG